MPPKKPPAESADRAPPASDAPAEKRADSKTDAAALRRAALHPSTIVMVKEAMKELDSRKGVSSQAIQNYVKQKYPSVDLVRLKPLVRKTLKKGIENGTFVRPASSSEAAGAAGKFRLAPKLKESKPKTENMDPNVQKAPKQAKKPKKAGATKKEDPEEPTKSQEDANPPKKSKAEGAATSKSVAPKKLKAKKAAEAGDGEGVADSTVTKAAKTTKEAKSAKASKSKAAKAGGDAPASKATGRRGKKTE